MQAVQLILFGLLLSFIVVNGDSDCNYNENLEAGQTYYAYNPEFPNMFKGERHCTWQMRSFYNIEIQCSLEMSYNCYQNSIYIQFDNGEWFNYCGYTSFTVTGKNPVLKFNSQYNSEGGRFLCKIQVLNNTCQCGWKKNTRIVGGEETGVNEYPMMAGIVNIIDRIIYCGATIISEEYLVTAAHCVENKNLNEIAILVGEHDVTTGSDTNATKLFPIDKYIIYPWYESDKIAHNDIAICKISGKITYSAEVGPVCLPIRHKYDSFDGNIVTALGWGLLEFAGAKSTTLQKVDLNVIPLFNCQSYYSNVTNANMCTYAPGKDTCQMDSGGPLLWQDPTTHRLLIAGITSSGSGCASNEPAVAMRTGAFIDWIRSVTPDAKYCSIE